MSKPFVGFNIKYPEYEVITPQSKKSFTVRTLTVNEEEHMKASYLSNAKLSDHLNRCIYSLLVKKPKGITDYASFMNNTTIKDREALLYGIYHISYDEVRIYSVQCSNPQCNKPYDVTVNISDTLGIKLYDGDEDILTKRVAVTDLPYLAGVTAYVKQPTLADEDGASKILGDYPSGVIAKSLIVDRFEMAAPELGEVRVISDRTEVIDGFNSLPPKAKKKIIDAYNENFGEYGIELKTNSVCPNCQNNQINEVDLVGQFFQMVFSD